MAKKNLASLMSGIMGDTRAEEMPPTNIEVENREIRQHLNESPAQEVKQRRKPGRPPRGSNGEKSDEIRATIIVEPEVMRKIKYISLMDDRMIKEVMNDALRDYISSWEQENGRIRLK